RHRMLAYVRDGEPGRVHQHVSPVGAEGGVSVRADQPKAQSPSPRPLELSLDQASYGASIDGSNVNTSGAMPSASDTAIAINPTNSAPARKRMSDAVSGKGGRSRPP